MASPDPRSYSRPVDSRRRPARLAHFVDARPGVLLAAALAVYALVTARVIVARPFWHDEIYTIALCRLPTMGAVWDALRSGIEQMPPLIHVLIRGALWLGGGAVEAIRVPAALGFALLPVCLYWTLRRRVPRVYALAGALVPFLTQALHFGYEGRSYGVVLGLAGVAVLSWDACSQAGRRSLALAGLALSTAAAVSCHYFALTIVFPLALGELVRTARARRIDYAVWAALAAPVVPLLFFLPLIRGARSFATAFWARPDAAALAGAYDYLLGLGGPLFVGLGLLWLGWLAARRRRGRAANIENLRPGIAVAAGFLALPALGVASSLITGAFAPRYTIWAVIGLALAIGYLGWASAGGSLGLGRALAAYLLVMALAVQVAAWRKWQRNGRDVAAVVARVERLSESGLPVVYADPIKYLQFDWYAPAALRERVYYLADPAAALRYVHSDSAERALVLLSRIFPVHLASARQFTQAYPRFYVVGAGDLSWLKTALVESGAEVTVRPPGPLGAVYDVRMTPDAATRLPR